MRQILLIPIVLLFNCSQTSESSSTEIIHQVDTIYTSDCSGKETAKRTLIRLGDTTELGEVNFKVGVTSYLKASVLRFEEYPIWIDSSANVELGTVDSVRGIFELTPIDSTFFLQFMQDYDSGNVVVKYSCENDTFSTYPVTGSHIVGFRTFQVEKKISD